MARSNLLSVREAIVEGLCDKREEERARNIDAALEEFCQGEDEEPVANCASCGKSEFLCGELVPESAKNPSKRICRACFENQRSESQGLAERGAVQFALDCFTSPSV